MGNTSKKPEIFPSAPREAGSGVVFEFGEFRLDPRERTLRRGGEVVPLTAKVFDTLTVLVEHGGHLASKDYLMKTLWPDSIVEEVNLNQNISVLRKALGESAQQPRFIVTVPGRGYRFAAPATRVSTGNLFANDVPSGPRAWRPGTTWFASAGVLKTAVLVLGIAGLAMGVAWYRVTIRNERPFLDPTHVRIMKVTESGKAPNAAISPDGRQIAYTENEGDEYSLWVKQMATGGKTQLVSREASILMHLTFSPDGNYLYFTRLTRNDAGIALYRIPAIGGRERLVLNDVDTPVSFSPDGDRFAFMRLGPDGVYQIVIANTDSGAERVLASRKTPLMFSYVGPAWSPDGKTVAASAADHSGESRWSIDILSVTDGSSREIYSSESQIGRLKWLPDGSGLLTVVSETLARQSAPWQAGTLSHVSGGALWRIAYPDGSAEQLTNDLTDYDICCVDLSGDGKTLTNVQNTLVSDLWIASADDLSRPRQITWGVPVFRRHSWLPDNDTIVYRDLNGHLNGVHKDGGAVTLSMPDTQKIVSGVSACGGRYLVFQATPGNRIWRMEQGSSHATRLTSGHLDSNPWCSADGKWVAYSSVTSTFPSIWRVPIEGGETTQIVREEGLEALPSPSGRLMYYLAVEWDELPVRTRRMRWVVMSLDDGKRQFSIDRPVNALLGVSPVWAPDDSGLDYVITRTGVSNIWRQPLDGGALRQITHFTSGTIFSFA